MDHKKIIKEINADLAGLLKARAVLSQAPQPDREAVVNPEHPRSRVYIMSASSRRRIADAQRKRWEKRREMLAEEERKAAAPYKAKQAAKKTKTNKKSPTA